MPPLSAKAEETFRWSRPCPQAEAEAWNLARKILDPWTRAGREIGSDELTRVMEKALEELNEAGARGRDELERTDAALSEG